MSAPYILVLYYSRSGHTAQMARLIARGIDDALAVLPLAVAAGRPGTTETIDPSKNNRDIMLCLDVSGSMTQATKDIAKRFFILLYLFLKRNYEKIEVVFIRNHTSAREVDEEEFFYSRETGGTIVSSALKMMQEIMAERYPAAEWNIYGAQASDGDNWNDDSPVCRDILLKQIMPFVQYYTYVEITPREHQALWFEYERVREAFEDSFAQQQIVSASDIYPVFRELFQRRLVA